MNVFNRPVPLMGSAGVSSNGGLSNGVTGTKGEVIILGFFAATKS